MIVAGSVLSGGSGAGRAGRRAGARGAVLGGVPVCANAFLTITCHGDTEFTEKTF